MKVQWLEGFDVEVVRADSLPAATFFARLKKHAKEPALPAPELDSASMEYLSQPTEVVHDIDDIIRGDDLVRYAVHAQLHRVDCTPDQIVGPNSPIDKSELMRCLAGSGAFPAHTLRALDDVILAIGGSKSHIGGLAPFASRMRELTDHAGVSVRVPGGWTRDSMRTKSNDEIHILVQASTLLNRFVVASDAGFPLDTIHQQNAVALDHLVERLILMAGGPPTPRHYEAQALLGSLAKFAFNIVLDQLQASIQHSPLGFRSWRSLTKLVMIARNDVQEGNEDLAHSLKEPMRRLVEGATKLRDRSINPGRSLDLEMFIAVPWDWAGEDRTGDKISHVLYERAIDNHATLRERGTAAMGLWQRAFDNHRADDRRIRAQVLELVAAFDDPERRPDIANGLSWVARTLDSVIKKNVAVCNEWPSVDEPWYRAVFDAADVLMQRGIPPALLPGTRNLFLHALLQNAGVERRKAIDALRCGGLVEPVAQAFAGLLQDVRTEPWLRVRVLFALGFLQVRDHITEADLVDACARAIDVVAEGRPNPSQIVELQTALFAIGDVFGVTGVEDQDAIDLAGQVRNNLAFNLTDLVDRQLLHDSGRHMVARALAYMLTFTAQPGRNDLSKRLLGVLREHPDTVTRRFCEWALGFRFADDHTIRPLLYGIQ
jgi:hypothetical protein